MRTYKPRLLLEDKPSEVSNLYFHSRSKPRGTFFMECPPLSLDFMYEVGTMSPLLISRRWYLTFGLQIEDQFITRTIDERIDGFFTRKEAASYHAALLTTTTNQ